MERSLESPSASQLRPGPTRAQSERVGVLLINIGTPDAPRPREVRRYLRQFLGDPRVLDIPALPRWLLLNAVILPTRPRRSAEAYAKVWSDAGSPLRIHSESLKSALQQRLGSSYVVELGMRYGHPGLAEGIDALLRQDVARVVLFPLFPQYASSSTGTALEAALELIARRWNVLPTATVGPFYDDPGFIGALAASAGPALREFQPDHVLMSYHGLPERQIRRSDASGAHCLEHASCCDRVVVANRHCYRAQAFATSRALAAALTLPSDRWSVAFQSRLGRTPWIRPYTDVRIPELAAQGVRRLAVLCPSFVADCLETVEEIGMRARDQWHELGGEAFLCVPCINADAAWVEAAEALVRSAAGDSAAQACPSA